MGAERNTYQLEIELPFPGSKHSANWTSTGWNWHENFEGRIEAPPVPKESLLIKFEFFCLISKSSRKMYSSTISFGSIEDVNGKGIEGREEWPMACEARDMWDSWLNGDHRGGQFPVNDRLLSG